jgi:hypothetical protein
MIKAIKFFGSRRFWWVGRKGETRFYFKPKLKRLKAQAVDEKTRILTKNKLYLSITYMCRGANCIEANFMLGAFSV